MREVRGPRVETAMTDVLNLAPAISRPVVGRLLRELVDAVLEEAAENAARAEALRRATRGPQ